MKLDTFIPDTFTVSPSFLGESGVTVDYTAVNDDCIIITVVACVILSALFWTITRAFLSYQIFNIFNPPREGGSRLHETEHQKKPLHYFILQFAVLAAVMCHIIATEGYHVCFTLPSVGIIAIYTAIILLGITLQSYIRAIPHSIYFELRQIRLYNTEYVTFMAYYGILMLPFVIIALFLFSDIILLTKILLFCLLLVKIIEISKVYSIFFRKNGRFLHFFLYLCTLEAVPILLTVGILALTTLILKSPTGY